MVVLTVVAVGGDTGSVGNVGFLRATSIKI